MDKIDKLIKDLGNPGLAMHAAISLGKMKAGRAVPALIEIMKNSDEYFTRYEAVAALGKIGDKRAIPALIEVLKVPGWLDLPIGCDDYYEAHWIQIKALEVLGGFDDTTALPDILGSSKYDHLKDHVPKSILELAGKVSAQNRAAILEYIIGYVNSDQFQEEMKKNSTDFEFITRIFSDALTKMKKKDAQSIMLKPKMKPPARSKMEMKATRRVPNA